MAPLATLELTILCYRKSEKYWVLTFHDYILPSILEGTHGRRTQFSQTSTHIHTSTHAGTCAYLCTPCTDMHTHTHTHPHKVTHSLTHPHSRSSLHSR